MRALGSAIGFRMPMCLSQVLLEVVSTKGLYDILVPMNSNLCNAFDVCYVCDVCNVGFVYMCLMYAMYVMYGMCVMYYIYVMYEI